MGEDKKKKVPDFIIIGAMKCGTTSVHNILAEHEAVFIPKAEPYFFDVDDIEQHPDFFARTSGGWVDHDFEKDFELYFEWYQRFFEPALPGQLIGEDSTTYIASKKAAERIYRLLPKVKLIAMLRDPVSRAYSHYWHNVSAGRETLSFDKALSHHGRTYLDRGLYKEQLIRFDRFARLGNLKVVLFEAFVADKQAVIDDLCTFLGLDRSIDVSTVDSHKNPATVPWIPPLRLLANRVYSELTAGKSKRNIPNMPTYRPPSPNGEMPKSSSLSSRAWDSLVRAFPQKHKYPPMSDQAKIFLERVFRRENAGLSELVGQDISKYWPHMTK